MKIFELYNELSKLKELGFEDLEIGCLDKCTGRVNSISIEKFHQAFHDTKSKYSMTGYSDTIPFVCCNIYNEDHIV